MSNVSAKKIVLSLIGIILSGILIWGIQWATFARPPLPQAVAAAQSDDLVTVTDTPWLTFTPTQGAVKTGFIFYPGGRINPLGYSDLMRAIAEKGYLVVVSTMPINMAIFNSNIADEIIAAHPEVDHWVIGGHSVGGTAAAMYTSAHPERIAGLAIWSSYPADSSDLSSLNIPALLMYGGNETDVTDESVGTRKHLLPPNTVYIKIKGGDHHQFGSYRLTTEENMATISREVQHEQILSAMLQLLQSIDDQ
ncbi:MAG: alpha/beta hydrolase [Chloroflexi bacterium]|nr:alpha/beta hydrolase [Chloroflexota bacterium]